MISQKRGSVIAMPLWFMFDLIMAVAVFLLLSAIVDNAAESTTFERNFLARDVALLLDALYAAPGSAAIDYRQNTLWFNFNFENGKVQVYDAAENRSILAIEKAIYPFIRDSMLDFNGKEVSPGMTPMRSESAFKKYAPFSLFSTNKPETTAGGSAALTFTKIGQGIFVNSAPPSEKLKCPNIASSKPASITLLPKTIDNKAYTFSDILRLQLAKNVPDIRTKDTTELGDEVILFMIKPASADTAKAYARSSSERSRKLACLVLNRISEKYISLMPAIEFSAEPALDKAPVSLILEIGANLQNQETASAIAKGFEDYYGK